MNILLIDPAQKLENSLELAGHTIHTLRPGGGLFHLPDILRQLHVSPDLVLQQESLGPRSYCSGLDKLDCPSLFWAIDSHLNMDWQQWYALLFDAVLTPHVSLFKALPEERRPHDLRYFAIFGERRPWHPHNKRSHFMSLCARLGPQRPIRNWLAELLVPEGLHIAQELLHHDMMDLYDDSCLVPNECLANESNFRLLEGASAGCLVLSPNVGSDQEVLLQAGKEFLVYHDGLELLEQTRWARQNPEAAQAMGEAARKRVQAEHLPEHRAAAVLDIASESSRNRHEGASAGLALWITLAVQIRNRRLGRDPLEHAAEASRLLDTLPCWQDLPLAERPFVSHALAQKLYLLAENPSREDKSFDLTASDPSWPLDEAFAMCRKLLEESQPPAVPAENAAGPAPRSPYAVPHPVHTLELASAASVFALRQKRPDMALEFWERYAGRSESGPPPEAAALCLHFARAWEAQGNTFTSGSLLTPEKGDLPGCALQCLHFASTIAPESQRHYTEQSVALLRDKPTMLAMATGYMANNCLLAPEDWQRQTDYGLACLQACRVEAGLFELGEAYSKAVQAGMGRVCKERLLASGKLTWPAVLSHLARS